MLSKKISLNEALKPAAVGSKRKAEDNLGTEKRQKIKS